MEKVTFSDWKKIPNLISIFRTIFIPIVIYFFLDVENQQWKIILSIIIFSILDNLDGYIARKTNQITELGKVIDPLVDKLFIITIAVNLFIAKLIPNWFFLLVVLRDTLIMLFGIFSLKKISKVPPSDFIGKLTVGSIGIIFTISLLNFQKLILIYNISLYICTGLIFTSLLNYSYKQIRKKDE